MLTQQQLQLIEDQLLGLGIKYIDLRYEILDHIATELEEKEGDFDENLECYFYENKLKLVQQYKKLTKQGISRAIRYYWKKLVSPLGFALFLLVFASVKYYLANYVDGWDVLPNTYFMFFPIIIASFWLGRGNKKLSVLRPLFQMYGFIYCAFTIIMACSSSLMRKNLSLYKEAMSYNSAITLALITVLLWSLYCYRRDYAIKYLKTN
ncbi:hypothetical protein [Flavobacterium alkalisoli]|uniref:hypothetical protein n=1 Tax=Flavobacterium alkalisoli TaxID=2602769 RepID=UPI003A9106FC